MLSYISRYDGKSVYLQSGVCVVLEQATARTP